MPPLNPAARPKPNREPVGETRRKKKPNLLTEPEVRARKRLGKKSSLSDSRLNNVSRVI
jgi:hypothetical protein